MNLGIDLGTTNSAAALASVQNGKLISTPLKIERFTDVNRQGGCRRERRELLPSCVTYFPISDQFQPIVGDAAKKISYTRPFAVAKSVKSQMGQEKLSYSEWDSRYPDQTPQAVSARIIRHILNQVRNMYYEDVDQAIITVPASFGIAQKRATLMAAEAAGLKVRDENGNYNDDMLLSEPEAVMYAILNQQANGELNLMCDFTTSKLIMVYDIGGGTLDITLHSISTNPNDPKSFNIKPIATNRFSQVAGDAIDRCLAEWMWTQYLADLESVDHDVVKRAMDKKPQCMAYMLRYAEELKESFSDQYYQNAEMGRELPMDAYINYGGEMPVGYDLESDMTRAQFEECLRPLMGEDLVFEDYRRFDKLGAYEHTILYPVLDVLSKGAQKLGSENIKIDMVILNGGMSRLPLIGQRLERFFRFPMTSVSDPDKTVAQGAAIYSYYHSLSNHSPMQEVKQPPSAATPTSPRVFVDITEPEVEQKIYSLGNVLPETIYLGLRGGTVKTLAEAGCDLPFSSEVISGLGLAPGDDKIDIPIKEKHGNNYDTVASGEILCGKKYHEEQNISIQFNISRSGIISLTAWLTGWNQPIGKVDIVLGKGESKNFYGRRRKRTLLPQTGEPLIPANELSSLMTLVTRYEREKSKKIISEKIRQKKTTILCCGNPGDFAFGLLQLLEQNYKPNTILHILPLARKMSSVWTDEQRKELTRFCLLWLGPDLEYYSATGGSRISANIEAIMAIGICGTPDDCKKLEPLMGQPRYEQALLYAFAHAGVHLNWIINIFYQHVDSLKSMQDSLQALGVAFYNQDNFSEIEDLVNVTKKTIELIKTGTIFSNVLNLALVALGILCRDQQGNCQLPEDIRQEAIEVTNGLSNWYKDDRFQKAQKAISTAHNLMLGTQLDDEEEKYLLYLLEK